MWFDDCRDRWFEVTKLPVELCIQWRRDRTRAIKTQKLWTINSATDEERLSAQQQTTKDYQFKSKVWGKIISCNKRLSALKARDEERLSLSAQKQTRKDYQVGISNKRVSTHGKAVSAKYEWQAQNIYSRAEMLERQVVDSRQVSELTEAVCESCAALLHISRDAQCSTHPSSTYTQRHSAAAATATTATTRSSLWKLCCTVSYLSQRSVHNSTFRLHTETHAYN